jgi:hypothetical protein
MDQLLEIDTVFLAALEELLNRYEDGALVIMLEEVAADAAASFIDRIYEINQYIQVDNDAKKSLIRIYLETWEELTRTKDIESTLRTCHYPRIRAYLKKLYPENLAEALKSSPMLGHVPHSEYSADLQIRVLRLKLSTIKEPLIDIGCGGNAYLVRYLRSKNIEAYGIDRIITHRAKFLTETDWFELPFISNKWGTVVSNLSFANHLVFAQKHDATRVPQYMNKYEEILDSLKVGGSFIYAPSVDGLDGLTTDREFVTEKWLISASYGATKITKKGES